MDLSVLQVEEILDVKFDKGKKYLTQLMNTPEPVWKSHRHLKHVPHLVEQFYVQRKQELDNILDSERTPDIICGHKYSPGSLKYLIKWLHIDECHLVDSGKMHQKYPQLVIEYWQGRIKHTSVDDGDYSEVWSTDENISMYYSFPTTPVITKIHKQQFVQEILSVHEENGELLFLVKFVNEDQTHFVRAKELNEKFPQVVIGFYEQLLD